MNCWTACWPQNMQSCGWRNGMIPMIDKRKTGGFCVLVFLRTASEESQKGEPLDEEGAGNTLVEA